jgi:hypothetical protein
MEMRSEEEFQATKDECKYTYPNRLCTEDNRRTLKFTKVYLKDLDIKENPMSLFRRQFFGMQPPYEFDDDNDVRKGLKGLKVAITKTLETSDIDESDDYENLKKIESNRIVALHCNVEKMKFVKSFISAMVLRLLAAQIGKKGKKSYRLLLNKLKVKSRVLYANLFKKYVESMFIL